MANRRDPDLPPLTITTDPRAGATVVAAKGFIDGLTAPGYTEYVMSVLAEKPSTLVLDLTDVDFLASAGLESLVFAHDAGGEATTVVVVAAGSATRRPIELTALDQTIALYRTLEDALNQVDD